MWPWVNETTVVGEESWYISDYYGICSKKEAPQYRIVTDGVDFYIQMLAYPEERSDGRRVVTRKGIWPAILKTVETGSCKYRKTAPVWILVTTEIDWDWGRSSVGAVGGGNCVSKPHANAFPRGYSSCENAQADIDKWLKGYWTWRNREEARTNLHVVTCKDNGAPTPPEG